MESSWIERFKLRRRRSTDRMSLMLRDAIAKASYLYATYEICGTRLMQAFLHPFGRILGRADERRSGALRMLGRL